MNLQRYYNQRANEYEAIYFRDDPVRQSELSQMADGLRQVVARRRVLEVACGTGFWTRHAADTAHHVLAVDASEEMLAVARGKSLPDKVSFVSGDAYNLRNISEGPFDAGLAMFWFSHVPRSRVDEFLMSFHRKLCPQAVVFLADNVLVPGVGGELIRKEGSQDTFKLRTLSDGSTHEILKNYYNEAELRRIFASRSTELRIHIGKCFWWVQYS